MPKPHPIQISIDDPCHQSWDDMTAAGQGRFCNTCQKTVIDFTTYRDAALYRFFATNPQNVCGRFLNTQLNVPINIPHQPHSRLYRMTVALGLTLLFTQTPALLAQNRPPIAAQQGAPGKTNNSLGIGANSTFSGRVYDERNEPMVSATIQVYQNDTLKAACVTDYDGYYTVMLPDTGYYDLLVSQQGYDSVRISDILMFPATNHIEHIKLKRKLSGLANTHTVTTGMVATKTLPTISVFSQTELQGHVKDKQGKALKDVTVRMYRNGNMIGERKTNEKGEYRAMWLDHGTYELHVLYLDHNEIIIRNVSVKGERTVRDITIRDKNKYKFTGGKTF